MKDAKSILDSLISGTGAVGQQAKDTWDAQSTGAKGAIAGGLLGVLLGGRGGLGGLVRVGGAAMIGSLASRAYADWKAGKPPLDAVTGVLGLPSPGSDATSDDLAARMLRAMISAAKADGHVTDDERTRIVAEVERLGIGDEARGLITEELAAPVDAARIAAMAGTEEEAAQLYSASLLAVNPDAPEEKAYLDGLAAAMKLPPDLVQHLHAQSAALVRA